MPFYTPLQRAFIATLREFAALPEAEWAPDELAETCFALCRVTAV